MTISSSQKTRRIAANTAILYVRMIITLLITLYSSRIVLQALGVVDFGLYNVVGGVVALLSFLRTSLTSATQRFISYEIGRNDSEQLKKIFSISVSTHIFISIIIFLIAETIGLWFLNTHIQIPDGREDAANYIYQFSVISLCISVITIPYNADVISHERMSYYAIVTIIEAILKLAFAYALFLFGFDKLILYGGLMMIVNIIDFIMYYAYCRKLFFETKYKFFFDRQLFLKIFSFSGWTIVGELSIVGANQGISILINMFHSLVANAAIGISQQVNNAIASLTANFQTAFQPQLTKSYAEKDYNYMNNLICKTSKISFFLIYLASLPIIINVDLILMIWLGDSVPAYTNHFCILFLVASIFEAISSPLRIGVYATGRIKNYQIVISTLYFSDIIIIYFIFCYLHTSPVIALVVKTMTNLIIVFIRMLFATKEVPGFSIKRYIKKTIVPMFIVIIITGALCSPLFFGKYNSIAKLIITLPLFAASCFVSYKIGLSVYERQYLISIIKKKIKR